MLVCVTYLSDLNPPPPNRENKNKNSQFAFGRTLLLSGFVIGYLLGGPGPLFETQDLPEHLDRQASAVRTKVLNPETRTGL